MKALFKSRLRKRIEAKIKSLAIECASTMYRKEGTNQVRDTTEYCKLVLKEASLNDDIKLLESLLK